MKRQPSEWEKIIANEASDKQLISKIYKQLLQLNSRKINDQIKNWAKEIDISPKKTYWWLTNTWKDAQHHSLLENANQNHNEMSPHTGQNGHHQKVLQTVNVREGVEKRECSCAVDENVNWYSHYGRWYGYSLKD